MSSEERLHELKEIEKTTSTCMASSDGSRCVALRDGIFLYDVLEKRDPKAFKKLQAEGDTNLGKIMVFRRVDLPARFGKTKEGYSLMQTIDGFRDKYIAGEIDVDLLKGNTCSASNASSVTTALGIGGTEFVESPGEKILDVLNRLLKLPDLFLKVKEELLKLRIIRLYGSGGVRSAIDAGEAAYTPGKSLDEKTVIEVNDKILRGVLNFDWDDALRGHSPAFIRDSSIDYTQFTSFSASPDMVELTCKVKHEIGTQEMKYHWDGSLYRYVDYSFNKI
jgi:hypothetical protein